MENDAPTRREAELGQKLTVAEMNAKIVAVTTDIEAMRRALRLTEAFPTTIDKAIERLRELHDLRFAALEQRLDEQRTAEKEARDKAEQSIREQLSAFDRTYQSRHETLLTMIGAAEKGITRFEGEKSGAAALWGWVAGLIGVVIAALAVGTRLPW